MNSPSSEGVLSFDVDARHIQQLGQELVGDRITAVSELIKNAYDADATEVRLSYELTEHSQTATALYLTDDGSGMTLQDIRDKWMVISTDTKVDGWVSERFARTRAGQKGIGRFSCESLGSSLEIATTVNGSSEKLIVEFRWDAYQAGVRLQDVTNRYHYETCDVDEHGTELAIRGLRHKWYREDLARVRDSVFLLQSPFSKQDAESRDHSLDPGLRVAIRWGDLQIADAAKGIVDDVYAAATAWLSGRVDDTGTPTLRVQSRHLRIDETRKSEKPLLVTGPCEFRAAYFVYARDALNPQSSLTAERARQLANTYGGIRLYRDDLRVMPYGEPNNDWLGLDALYRRRGEVLAPIGNRNFFGEVLLTRGDNVLIVDTASREGVVENEAFSELRDFLRDSIVWAVGLVASIRDRKTKAGAKRSRRPRATASRSQIVRRLQDSAKRLESADNEEQHVAAITHLKESIRLATTEASQSDVAEEEKHSELIDEITLLRVLASLGGSVAVFSHEVRAVLSQASAAVGDLAEQITDDTSRTALDAAEDSLHSLMDLAAYLEMHLSETSRRNRTELAVSNLIEAFVARVEPLLSRRGITIETDFDELHYRTREMAKSEFEAVLFNLLSNAVRAVDREGQTLKRIRIAVIAEGKSVCISFFDTGVGIPRADWRRVFEAFYTTSTAADAELGFGTGLGLTIVSDIVTANDGRVSVVQAPEPYSTCIQVNLPLAA